MLRCGLTGGIGSGKSTVAAGLVQRGAVLIDADRVAREVVEPGRPALAAIVSRFGAGVLGPDGRLDRAALAEVVFADAEARAALEAITHPVVGAEMLARADALGATDAVVIFDVPLLRRATRTSYRLDVVVVVDAPEDVAVARLVAQRGFAEADARARVAAQIGRAERRALADRVVDNTGELAVLDAQLDDLWAWLRSLPQDPAGGP